MLALYKKNKEGDVVEDLFNVSRFLKIYKGESSLPSTYY